LEETPWHPRKFAADISEDFVDIIADMMEKDPTKRITSAAEVAARLEPWVSEAQVVGAVGMSRSPWMAPPLLSDDDDRGSGELAQASSARRLARPLAEPPWGEASSDDGLSAESQTPSGSMADSASGAAVFPPLEPSVSPTASSRGTFNTGLVIALTVAVVVPPALLIGAILGYLAAQ
jgi:serine/threonine protein kinase